MLQPQQIQSLIHRRLGAATWALRYCYYCCCCYDFCYQWPATSIARDKAAGQLFRLLPSPAAPWSAAICWNEPHSRVPNWRRSSWCPLPVQWGRLIVFDGERGGKYRLVSHLASSRVTTSSASRGIGSGSRIRRGSNSPQTEAPRRAPRKMSR